jgi:hypothetical protein
MAARASNVDLFDVAAAATHRLAAVRDFAREEAVAAVRVLEARLRDALAGEKLRGLSNLTPWLPSRYVAARVGGGDRYGIDRNLPDDGREAIVVTRDGTLAVARVDGTAVVEREVEDDDIFAEDHEAVARAVLEVLERYVSGAGKAERNYARAGDLARRVSAALR